MLKQQNDEMSSNPNTCIKFFITIHFLSGENGGKCKITIHKRSLDVESRDFAIDPFQLAERVGFEPTWELTPPIRFRVGAVMAASVPLQLALHYNFIGNNQLYIFSSSPAQYFPLV